MPDEETAVGASAPSEIEAPEPPVTPTLGDRIMKELAQRSWNLADLERVTQIKAETWFKLIRGGGHMSPIIADALADAFSDGKDAGAWAALPIALQADARPAIKPDTSCPLCSGTGRIIFIHDGKRDSAPCRRCLDRARRKPRTPPAPGEIKAPGAVTVAEDESSAPSPLGHALARARLVEASALERVGDLEASISSIQAPLDAKEQEASLRIAQLQEQADASHELHRVLSRKSDRIIEELHSVEEKRREAGVKAECLLEEKYEASQAMEEIRKLKAGSVVQERRMLEKAMVKLNKARRRVEQLEGRVARRRPSAED